jgi:hypothetical protein
LMSIRRHRLPKGIEAADIQERCRWACRSHIGSTVPSPRRHPRPKWPSREVSVPSWCWKERRVQNEYQIKSTTTPKREDSTGRRRRPECTLDFAHASAVFLQQGSGEGEKKPSGTASKMVCHVGGDHPRGSSRQAAWGWAAGRAPIAKPFRKRQGGGGHGTEFRSRPQRVFWSEGLEGPWRCDAPGCKCGLTPVS